MSGFSFGTYISPSSSVPPLFFFFTSPVTYNLFHSPFSVSPCQTSEISDSMGLLTPFRLFCYVLLVCPQSALLGIPIDPDMFLSGCLRLARWVWLLQDCTILSTSRSTTPSTVVFTFTVCNPHRHRCSCQTLTLDDVSPDKIIAEILAAAGLTILFTPLL